MSKLLARILRTERGVQKDFEKCSNSTQSAVSLKLLYTTQQHVHVYNYKRRRLSACGCVVSIKHQIMHIFHGNILVLQPHNTARIQTVLAKTSNVSTII